MLGAWNPKGEQLGRGWKGLCLSFFFLLYLLFSLAVCLLWAGQGVYSLKCFSWAKRTPAPCPLKKYLNKYFKIFIYLAVPVLVTALRTFDHYLSRMTLTHGMRGLVSWPGLKLRPPCTENGVLVTGPLGKSPPVFAFVLILSLYVALNFPPVSNIVLGRRWVFNCLVKWAQFLLLIFRKLES